MSTPDPAYLSASPLRSSGSPEIVSATAGTPAPQRAAMAATGVSGAHALMDDGTKAAALRGFLHGRPLRIAQIGPLIERVPPRLYGGTERIVSYLTEELVAMGHDVTLFASGRSITSARLVACCEQELRLNPAVRDPIPYYMVMLDKVRRMASQFDILHFHIDQFHFPVFHDMAARCLTTLHGRQDLLDLAAPLRRLPRDAADLDFAGAARAHRQVATSPATSPTACRATCSPPPSSGAAAIWRFWAASRRRSASTGRWRSPAPSGCRSRSPPRSTASTSNISARTSSRCSPSPRSSISARSTRPRRPRSSGKRARSCFRSTGRSPSGLP